jgi:hypothetical protein
VVVRNRGDLPLQIGEIKSTDDAFTPSAAALQVPPGQGDFFEVTYAPPASSGQQTLCLASNDPDPQDAVFKLGLLAQGNSRLGVGDALDDSFAFLDPSGQNQVAGLNGHVVVLAYFALF